MRRPAPVSRDTSPTAMASMRFTNPSSSARTGRAQAASGSRDGSSVTRTSPPWARIISCSFFRPSPSARAWPAIFRPVSASGARPPRKAIAPVSSSTSSVKSAGPLPRRVSIASRTSRAFPTASPRGWSMSVIRAAIFRPALRPMATISRASSRASPRSFMKAPLPHFTSSRTASLPDASFLLIILLAIRLLFSTVPVTSRRAYIFLSAGVRLPVCPVTAMPILRTCSRNSSSPSRVLNPGIASSLSMVPPLKPRPRPLIFATGTPRAAARGPAASVALSPTPPVECLSTFNPGMSERSMVSPDRRMASVRRNVS